MLDCIDWKNLVTWCRKDSLMSGPEKMMMLKRIQKESKTQRVVTRRMKDLLNSSSAREITRIEKMLPNNEENVFLNKDTLNNPLFYNIHIQRLQWTLKRCLKQSKSLKYVIKQFYANRFWAQTKWCFESCSPNFLFIEG